MTKRTRPAFTLIELITVVSIIFILAAMIVGVAYTGTNKQASSQGATAIVGWCKTAQAYALRDQKPYGIRFDLTSTHTPSGALFIEQPMDWTGPVGSTVTSTCVGTGINITGTGTDFTGGGTSPIKLNDYFECNGGQISVITGVSSGTKLTANMQPGDTAAMWTFASSSNFRIVRQPRAMIGADVVQLPRDVIIDLDTSSFAPPAPQYKTNLPIQGTQLDILFAPNGSVIGNPGMIRLWVRDTSSPPVSPGVFKGEQFIVCINGTTGLVGIQQVNTTITAASSPFYATPYSFTQDGKAGGY